MKKEVRILLCVLAVGFMLFWLLSVAYCEVLTLRYGHEFADSWEQNTMLSQPDSIKVLEYSHTSAKIYIRSSEGGNILVLSQSEPGGIWKMTVWETVWSRMGSADDFVWPYIR